MGASAKHDGVSDLGARRSSNGNNVDSDRGASVHDAGAR